MNFNAVNRSVKRGALFQRGAVLLCILAAAFHEPAVLAGETWIKVNCGNALTTGFVSTVVKNDRGHICYVINEWDLERKIVRGMFLGRFNTDTKTWERFSDGSWSQTAEPTSITNTLGMADPLPQVNPSMQLFPHPGIPDGLLGTLSWNFSLTYGSQTVDVHSNSGAVLFDGLQWRQWHTGGVYSPYFMNRLTPGGTFADVAAFSFDPGSCTGLYLGANSEPDGFTASRFKLDTQTWELWRNGAWTTDRGILTNLNPLESGAYAPAAIVPLRGGEFIAALQRDSGNELYAVHYTDMPQPAWSWWDGAAWRQGGPYQLSTLADNLRYRYRNAQLLATPSGATLFFVDQSGLCEITYDRVTRTFGAKHVIAAAPAISSYTQSVAADGTIWLYYCQQNEIRLTKKAPAGQWSAPESIYAVDTPLQRWLVGAVFAGNEPMLFVTDVNGANHTNKTSFVLSAPQSFTYWSGEQGLLPLVPPMVSEVPDGSQLTLLRQVEQRAPANMYRGEWASGPLAVDSDGYLYAPDPGTCSVTIRPASETNWQNAVAWGSFWDHLHFPGGVAVDNRRNKVYVANRIFEGGIDGVMTWGSVKVFDRARRAEFLGFQQTLPGTNQWYQPQKFGAYSWPADVSVDEERGLLYVSNSSENRIDVYDIEHLARASGDAAQFWRSDLGFNDAGGNAIIGDLVAHGALAWVANPGGKLYWATSDINSAVAWIRAQASYQSYPANAQFLRNIQDSYKDRCDLPVLLRSLGTEGMGNGQFRFPQGTAVDPNGNLYVADCLNHRIQKFDANGNFVASWGALGTENGHFIYPFSIAADPTYNLIYITDPAACRVQIFDRNGTFLTAWKTSLNGVTADGTGKVYFSGIGVEQQQLWIYTFQIVDPDIDNDQNGIPDSLQQFLPGNNRPDAAIAVSYPFGNASRPTLIQFNSTCADPDGDQIVAWEWSLKENADGPFRVISTQPHCGLHLDRVVVPYIHLRVKDARGAWSFRVNAGFEIPNRQPIAMPRASVLSGAAPLTVDFSSASFDFDGDALTCQWSIANRWPWYDTPNVRHTFTNPGTYRCWLYVNDGINSNSAEITVTVTSPANQIPVVNAGADQTITSSTFPATCQLSGAATDDGVPQALTTRWYSFSGARFTSPASPITEAVFDYPGVYMLTLSASDGVFTVYDQVKITVNVAANQRPLVDAGPDQTVIFPDVAILNGTVTDDGRPEGGHNFVSWSVQNPFVPGAAVIESPSSLSTRVTFSQPGTYVLRLTASDGSDGSQGMNYDDITITVNPRYSGPNDAPVVAAGADQAITLPSVALLAGAVADDGIPGPLSLRWQMLYGPGEVRFDNASSAVTNATFSIDGAYVLRLTANDGLRLGHDDIAIVVNRNPSGPWPNQLPAVHAGPDQTITTLQRATLRGSAVDDERPRGMTFLWRQVSGPGDVVFTDRTALTTMASFTAAGVFVLRLAAYDGAACSCDDITITVEYQYNSPPNVSAGPDQSIMLPQNAMLEGTAIDDGRPGPLTLAWSKVSGPGAVIFGNAAAAVTTAAFSAAGEYVLRLTADDGAASAHDDVTVRVGAPSDQVELDPPPATTSGEPEPETDIDPALNQKVELRDDVVVGWPPIILPDTYAFRHLSGSIATRGNGDAVARLSGSMDFFNRVSELEGRQVFVSVAGTVVTFVMNKKGWARNKHGSLRLRAIECPTNFIAVIKGRFKLAGDVAEVQVALETAEIRYRTLLNAVKVKPGKIKLAPKKQ